MYCKNCGEKLSDEARWCPNCGTPVDRDMLADMPNGNQNPENLYGSYTNQRNNTNPYGNSQANTTNNNPYGNSQVNATNSNPYGNNQANATNSNPYGNSQANTTNSNPYGILANANPLEKFSDEKSKNSDKKKKANPKQEGELLKENWNIWKVLILNLLTCGIYSFYTLSKQAKDINIACEGDGKETAGLGKLLLLSLITCGIYGWVWNYQISDRVSKNAERYGLQFEKNASDIVLLMVLGSVTCGITSLIALNILYNNINELCHAYNTQG